MSIRGCVPGCLKAVRNRYALLSCSISCFHCRPRAECARGFAINRIEQNFSAKQGVFVALIEGLRLHQWAKNVLIFVPLLLSGTIQSLDAWIACVIGFFAWGILASSTYLLNDLWDLESDRSHWSKWRRPIARGDLPIPLAVAHGDRRHRRQPGHRLDAHDRRTPDPRRLCGADHHLLALAEAPAHHRRVPAGLPLHAAPVLRHRAGGHLLLALAAGLLDVRVPVAVAGQALHRGRPRRHVSAARRSRDAATSPRMRR